MNGVTNQRLLLPAEAQYFPFSARLMFDLEALYQRFPVPLQNAIVSLEGLRLRRTRMGDDFQKICGEAQIREQWDLAQLTHYRTNQLRELFSQAACAPF